jgi:HK97 family phage portal protein
MLNRLKSLFAPETKRSVAAPLIAWQSFGRAAWTPANYAALARAGFNGNVVGYRCVRMIAEAVASLPWLLYRNEQELIRHPLLALLQRPSPAASGRELLESFCGHLLVAGNGYLELVLLDGGPRELHALRPDRMRAVPSPEGWPEAYQYSVGGAMVRLAREHVLHLRLFNPLDDHYGLSPLEAAAKGIDTHNAAAAWNKAMLDNAARPSGALVYKAADGANTLSIDQFDRLKREVDDRYQGGENAGRPLLLEGGLDWKEMSLSPKDMDFIEAKNMAAREIALGFGVPPMLLGIPGDNTFANFAEANRTLWRQTVLPLAARLAEALGNWLAPHYGEGLRLTHDLDQVDALAGERDALWARIGAAEFLTTDEKRAAVGYGRIASGE